MLSSSTFLSSTALSRKSDLMAKKKEFVPIEYVQKLAAQGRSEPQIIAELRSHGFTPSQIDRAIKEALKAEVTKADEPARVPAPPSRPDRHARPGPMEPRVERRPVELRRAPARLAAPEPKRPDILPPAPAGGARPPALAQRISVEELVESVVQEKWMQADRKLKEIETRDEEREEKMEEFESRIMKMRREEKKEETGLLRVMDGIQTELEKLETRINALEKAFKGFSKTRKKK